MVFLDLPEHVHSFKPDLVYINSEPENYQTCHTAYALRHSRSIKLVFSTWRNIDYRSIGFPYKLGFLNALAEQYVLAHADHGVAFNDRAGPIFRELGFPGMTMIPPDLDLAVFRRRGVNEVREKLGLRKFTLGYAGRLADQKGIPDLFRASALVGFEHQILIVGVGPMKDRLVALGKELQIADKIVWMEPVRRHDMPPLISAMDVLVLPSRTGKWWKEQFGRVLIEAMACEVPVVGSDSGEIPAVVGEEGLIFREGDPVELASALTTLYENAELRSILAAKGLQKVKSTYAVEKVAPLYAALFQLLLDRAG